MSILENKKLVVADLRRNCWGHLWLVSWYACWGWKLALWAMLSSWQGFYCTQDLQHLVSVFLLSPNRSPWKTTTGGHWARNRKGMRIDHASFVYIKLFVAVVIPRPWYSPGSSTLQCKHGGHFSTSTYPWKPATTCLFILKQNYSKNKEVSSWTAKLHNISLPLLREVFSAHISNKKHWSILIDMNNLWTQNVDDYFF